MIIGVDLGTYGVKTSEKVALKSKISEGEKFTSENEIIYEGQKIYVGEGEFSTDWNKSKKENTLPLLYTALGRSSEENLFQVVLGLPIQQYKTHRQELINYIECNRSKTIEVDGVERDIIITDVEVAPEGASSYYNLDVEVKKLIGNKPLTIVDIGGRTTDICVFENKKITKYKTIPIGMLNVYSDVVTEVNSRYTESFKLEDGEVILREGLFLYGENKDLEFIKPILKRNFESIYKDLQLNFDIAKGYVFLTGGGTFTFNKAFKNRLKNIIVSNNPIFDNVIGFKKVGEQQWLER